MMHLSTAAVLLVLACISDQILEAECQREKGRGGKRESQQRLSVPPSDRNDNGPKSAGGKGIFKGRFSAKDKAQCTWVATGDEEFVLGVTCKKGAKSFDCAYVAKPTTCPQYASNAKLYWKQIARSLKKQRKLCYDGTSLIKAGMCRKAPEDAHFKLSQTPKETAKPKSASSKDNELCQDQIDKKTFAEEYCSHSWTSLCAFLFTMIQSEDC
ncbi:fibroblast growth factor-binding protein 1 [Clupea harengus]|uniref:Fibroblast growth factor-binding protein 1 n=1 Tax=Clupea harengus TaxID=7950 RepID=A0A6P3W1Q0_CLUHA|nr:fibroblast growth factor-binding protein 1 [Clupea harengus]XP_031443249.1 fibroblast growth factor-binding protein 1 [Clupea harengus]